MGANNRRLDELRVEVGVNDRLKKQLVRSRLKRMGCTWGKTGR